MLNLLIITCSGLSAGGLTFVQCGIRGTPGLLLTQTAGIKGKCAQRPATLIPKPATHTHTQSRELDWMTCTHYHDRPPALDSLSSSTWTGPLEPCCPRDRQKTEGQIGEVKKKKKRKLTMLQFISYINRHPNLFIITKNSLCKHLKWSGWSTDDFDLDWKGWWKKWST